MSNTLIILLVVGVSIIAALAFYAGSLFAQVKKQRVSQQQAMQSQQEAIDKHNNKLIESIQLIAKAVTEQQCELSEAAIRICRLLEKVYIEQDAAYPEAYPSLHQLDTFLSDYPTHAAYKALKRQERMRFDVKRAQKEDQLKAAVESECQTLLTFSV